MSFAVFACDLSQIMLWVFVVFDSAAVSVDLPIDIFTDKWYTTDIRRKVKFTLWKIQKEQR